MLIIFEGPDGAGKTTLRKSIDKAIQFRYATVDRLYVTQFVYDTLFNRKEYSDLQIRQKLEQEFKDFIKITNPVFVYVLAAIPILMERISFRGEDIRIQPNMEKTIELYSYWFEYFNLKSRTIKIDTTMNNIEYCTNMIVNKIHEMEREN